MEDYNIVLNKGEKNERIVFFHPPKARAVRDAIELNDEVFVKDSINTPKKLDKVLDRVVKYYDDLTIDDVYDGLSANELISFIQDNIDLIMAGTTRRLMSKKLAEAGEKASH